ncbi:MAG: hypothetical protein OES09_13470 [Gammaproteobacteria bacterium]|nr:hypothetical protein [Gammaproteobacteria bacterium]
MRRLLLALLSAGALGGCATADITDESAPRIRIPAGSRLTLTQDVAIPDGWARVAIQDGAVVAARNDIVRPRPHCELGTDTVSRRDDPQIVKADEFVVRKVTYKDSLTVGRDNKTFTTTMLLEPGQQPNVKRLACEHTGDPMFTTRLTIEQIREALGGIIELQMVQ